MQNTHLKHPAQRVQATSGRKFSAVIAACFAVLTALVLAPSLLHAQIAGTANIQGTVTDSTGAVVSDANITLTDEATQVKRTSKSDNSGVYLFPGVPVGTYDVTVTATGFKTYEQKGIVLEVGSSIASTQASPSAPQSQTSRSRPKALALQTEDATFKQTIDQQRRDRDAAQRPPDDGLITASGGSNIAPAGDFTGSKYSYQTISVSIAGGGGNTTLWRLDGGDNQDYMANGNLPYPFPDAVSRVQRGIDGPGRAGWRHTWAAWSTSSPNRERTSTTAKALSSFATTTSMPQISFQAALRWPRYHLLGERHAAPESVRRHVRRPDQAQQDVCVRSLPALESRSITGKHIRPRYPRRQSDWRLVSDRWRSRPNWHPAASQPKATFAIQAACGPNVGPTHRHDAHWKQISDQADLQCAGAGIETPTCQYQCGNRPEQLRVCLATPSRTQ